MPVDAQDVKQVADELGAKFTEFKAKHDKELEAIKAEKSKLTESVDILNGKLGELDQLKQDLEKELLEVKRPDRKSVV